MEIRRSLEPEKFRLLLAPEAAPTLILKVPAKAALSRIPNDRQHVLTESAPAHQVRWLLRTLGYASALISNCPRHHFTRMK